MHPRVICDMHLPTMQDGQHVEALIQGRRTQAVRAASQSKAEKHLNLVNRVLLSKDERKMAFEPCHKNTRRHISSSDEYTLAC